MSGPIIIINRSEIREGKLEALRTAVSELVAYGAYLDDEATRATVLQMNPYSPSAEFHTQVAGSAYPGFAASLRLSGIDVYGSPGAERLERLHRKAGMLGGGAVAVHGLRAGLTRFGASRPGEPD